MVALLGMHYRQAMSELCANWPHSPADPQLLSQVLVQILAVDELQILEMAAAQSGAAGVGQGIVQAIQAWCVGAYPSLHP